MLRASGLRSAALRHLHEQKEDLMERSGVKTSDKILGGLLLYTDLSKTCTTMKTHLLHIMSF